ncbi:MAG: EAL domain-containing protein [Halanaerobiaceae bacterium]|nr:EAL domain-containing protein [Halanaerobiaceae bacterium]
MIYIFSISPMAAERYDFVRTATGWINISPSDIIWDWFFNIYYISYTILSLYLIYKWGRKSDRENDRRQSMLIVVFFSLAAVLGTITDIVFSKHSDLKVPQLAPVIGLIPLSAIFYCIKRYGLMQPEGDREVKPGIILSEYALSKYYNFVAYTYIAGSLVYFLSEYYVKRNLLSDILPLGLFIFLAGAVIWFMPIFIRREVMRDIIFTGILSLTVPLITIFFVSPGNTTVVWVLPIISLLFSIIYNNQYLLFSIGISGLFVQVYLWIKAPETFVMIDSTVYLKRFSIIIMFLFIAFYIYRVYLFRLKENEDKVKLQKIVSEISAQFVSATADTIDERNYDFINISGSFLGAEKAFVYIFSRGKITHEWYNEEHMGNRDSTKDFLEDYFADLDENNVLYKFNKFSVLQKLTDKYGLEIVLIPVPLIKKEKIIGLVAYVLSPDSVYNEDHQNVLEILANIISDTMARIESEEHITHLAYHDSLTDLPNKRYFDEFVTDEIAKEPKGSKALIIVNYKDFSLLSMTYGYNYANKIIKETAGELLNFCSDGKRLFHVAKDHFTVWVSNYKDKDELEKLCEDIISKLQVKFADKVNGGNIGIVEIDKFSADSDTLVKYASIAANSIKDKQAWGYSYFTEQMELEINRKHQIESELKQLINGDGGSAILYLKYQPIVELKTNKIAGFEALARIESRTFGEILPYEFIPIAEETQQIYQLGELIIQKACQFLKELEANGYPELKVMLNISILQILREEFLEDFLRIIREHRIDTSRIGIELTESVFSNDYLIINEKLTTLQDLGINIAIDDFGTGYSSFARERELNVNCLKIDKYFIDKLLEINTDNAITGDIISMAHKLGHKAIAEGVESEIQKQYLIENDCDYMQGYLFCKPVLKEQALELLQKYR